MTKLLVSVPVFCKSGEIRNEAQTWGRLNIKLSQMNEEPKVNSPVDSNTENITNVAASGGCHCWLDITLRDMCCAAYLCHDCFGHEVLLVGAAPKVPC